MSEWDKAKGEAKKGYKEMEKAIESYSYKNVKHAEKTDVEYRKLITTDVRKSRDLVFPMIEAAYLEQDFKNASALEDIMQWLDVFLLELGLQLEWSDMADYKDHVKIIKTDVTLLNNANRLVDILQVFQDKTLHGNAGSVVKKAEQVRKYIADLLSLFKKRRHALGG